MARSGTTLLTTAFRDGWGDRVRAEHEPLHHAARLRHLFRCFDADRQDEALREPAIGNLVRSLVRSADSRPVLVFGNTLSHLAPVFHRVLGNRLRLLHLHRDPVHAAASIYVKTRPEWWSRVGRYEEDPYGLRITPFDPHARFVEYRERWSSLSLFEKILYQWLERHAFALEAAERLPGVPFRSLRSEDLFANPDETIRDLAGFIGLDPPAPPTLGRARRNETWMRSLERQPLGERWRAYGAHPAVLELAAALGHTVDSDGLEAAMARYQLPRGFLPWLRHRTGYWDRRARTADWLRAKGIVPSATDEARGLPPRSLPVALREILLPRRRA